MTNETDQATAPAAPPVGETAASPRPRIELGLVVLDTDDPKGLSSFYCALLGWEVTDADDDWVTIRGKDGAGLAFQLSVNHIPPTWPVGNVPQQFHLDLEVADLSAAAAYAESVGAKRVPSAGKERSFIVFTDPSGHPFCLCTSDELAAVGAAEPQ
jgi:hypothetical protein